MRLTKKEALKRCAEMWDDLAKTGSDDKEEVFKRLWPDFVQYDGEYGLDCWACEYKERNGSGYCNAGCIMAEVWGGGFCLETGSAYDNWCGALKSGSRKKWAKVIADGARECLAKLEGGK